jgi:hypothetical protein
MPLSRIPGVTRAPDSECQCIQVRLRRCPPGRRARARRPAAGGRAAAPLHADSDTESIRTRKSRVTFGPGRTRGSDLGAPGHGPRALSSLPRPCTP